MPISLHHAQVFYPPGEEAQARDFYGKALGLEEIHRPETLSDREGIWFSAPPGHVHLSADKDLGLHPRRHFALRVDDLDATRNRLREVLDHVDDDECSLHEQTLAKRKEDGRCRPLLCRVSPGISGGRPWRCRSGRPS